MNFIGPATQITAAHWNDIFQAADTALTNALGGLSAILAGADKQFDRAFFFFDPLNVSATSLHPQAQGYQTNNLFGQGLKSTSQQAMYFRQYSHSAITGIVSGLSTSGSPVHGVQKLSKPTWSAWSAAIYPSGFSSLSTSSMFAGTVPADNILDVSLGVIQASGNAVTFNNLTTAEHAQPLKPVDVFIIGNVTWDNTNWNKYSLVRVHNCGRAAATIFSTSISAGASRCFRKLSGTWTAQGNYFHWMQSGDGRFLQMRETAQISGHSTYDAVPSSASIFQPGIVADILWNLLINTDAGAPSVLSNFGQYFDPAKFWDMGGVYNNASYTPTGTEKAPPSGGWLPALNPSALIGDLIVPKGQFIIANHYLSTFAAVNFTGFAALASALAAAGTSLATRTLSQTETTVDYPATNTLNNLEIYDASGRLELVDTGCPLVTFLTGGNPAASVGAMGTSGSLKLPWLIFGAINVADTPTTNTFNFYDWYLDGTGTPQQGAMQTVTVNNDGSTASAVAKPFLPTDSVNTVAAWMASASNLAIQNITVLSTPFGPVLLWDEVWPLNARFTAILTYGSGYTTLIKTARVVCDQSQGSSLRVTRAYFLNECRYTLGTLPTESGVWPPSVNSTAQYPSQCLFWNYARTDEAYIWTRYFYHDPSLAPMMPNWTAYSQGGTSNYATFKFLPGGIYDDDLSTDEWNTVISFYEANPIGVDTVTAPHVVKKTGISRMGQFNRGCDIWGPFSHWLNASGNLTYPLAPDFMSGNGSISINSAWYGSNYGSVLSNSPNPNPVYTDPVPIAPNALPCQCEQFNLLAGLVAAMPPMKAVCELAGGTSYTLNFAAGNMVILAGGTGYTAGQSLGFNLKVGSIDSNGGITSIAQDGAVIINTYDAYSTPQRPFTAAQTFGGSVIAAYFDTTVGDGSTLSFIPTFNPIGVPLPPTTSLPYMQAPTVYGASNFFPRGTFFAWNGAPTGCADPLGTYIASLAAGVTVETTLPDGYGASILNEYGQWVYETYYSRTGNTTSFIWGSASPGEWCEGFTPQFTVLAATYRWITIDTARAIYAAWSMPFALNQVYAPMSFQNVVGNFIEISLGSSANRTPATGGVNTAPPVSTNAAAEAEYNAWVAANIPYPTIVPPTTGGTPVRVVDFVNDPNGNWLCDATIGNISNSPIINQRGGTALNVTKTQYSNPQLLGIVGGGGAGGVVASYCYDTDNSFFYERLDCGVLDPVSRGTVNSPLTALVYLLEGVPDQAVAALPQNYAYLDPNFVPERDLSGLSNVVPYIVDNSLEQGAGGVGVIPGAGGAHAYDHTLTTGLANVRLVQIPIDGEIAMPIPGGNL